MDNYQGDLTDIIRASGGGGEAEYWQFPAAGEPMSVDHRTDMDMDMDMFHDPIINNIPPLHGFGNPFSSMRDPLLHTSLFALNTSPSQHMINITNIATAAPGAADSPRFLNNSILGPKIFDEDHVIMNPNRMLQISTGKLAVSPCGSPVVGGGSTAIGDIMINANSSPQISSPRNPAIKRRKSQAKKVVCIPAPASANSRPTGEVVPSDLWAWRKYGQKPIKGSPYPRGYYRCSSSKGCSARKQVERSRTDPNMLVITYTSEHNHPWPTQRNALAGSTRSQPSKNNNNNSSSANSKPLKMATSSKEEQVSDQAASPSNIGSSSTVASVKEEMHDMEKQPEAEDGFSYRPALPDMSEQDCFFADLDEIEADPLRLLFTQGFTSTDHEKKDHNKALEDQFSLFDWSEDNNKGL